MNKAEMLAFELLKKRGYKEEDIIYQGSKNPDFVCSDGKRFEVKRVYGKNELLFTEKQMEELRDTDTILVFDTEHKELKDEFLWPGEQIDFIIKVIKYPKNKFQITISDRMYTILEKLAKKGDKHILTLAGTLLSDKLEETEKKGRFDDGFG